jgi:hypothetical protein
MAKIEITDKSKSSVVMSLGNTEMNLENGSNFRSAV